MCVHVISPWNGSRIYIRLENNVHGETVGSTETTPAYVML